MTIIENIIARRRARQAKSIQTMHDYIEAEGDLTLALWHMYENPLRVRAEYREEVQLVFDFSDLKLQAAAGVPH